MTEHGGNRRDEVSKVRGAGGVRAPAPGESSSPEIPAPDLSGFDSPTLLNIPAKDILSGSPAPVYTSPAPLRSPAPQSPPPGSSGGPNLGDDELTPGTLVGNRYEIIQMLGIGGMGAVYKAMDVELKRTIALKVIRPEFARDRSILERFKQELILSTTVTHKNVIRIYDLGEADGMKFITMEFVEGHDLRAVLHEKKKFPPEEAIGIIRQVCRALRAAHEVGVVHRDLKPQNIMCESSGRMIVMDFGLARTFEDNGMTQSGALVGTMEYMSPEQALAKDVDQRSDLFALGIIFYELLSGEIPFKADSAVASLIKRTQERVVPVGDLDPNIPAALSAIVSKCLERDVTLRYQSAAQILTDLDAYEGKGPMTQLVAYPGLPDSIKPTPPKRKLPLPLIGGLLVATVLVVSLGYNFRGAYVKSQATQQGAATGPLINLAVLPLKNASADPTIDWLGTSLSDSLSTSVGQSAHLHTIPPSKLEQVYSDLRLNSESTLDPETLRRIADSTSADTVVSGRYDHAGDQIHITVLVQDLKKNHSVALQAQGPEKDLSKTIDGLADQIRKNLSLSADDLKQVQAQSFKPTSSSPDALRAYNQAMEYIRVGRNIDARTSLLSTVKADPQFALAYAKLGEAQSDLGYQPEAEQSSRKAVELADSQNLPPAAKFIIQASHSRVMQESKKAIDAYENLARNLPGDMDVQFALGNLYLNTGDYVKARAQFTHILKEDPKNLRALWGMGIVEITSNNPQAALEPLSQGLTLSIQTDNAEMKGLILLSMGISYRLLHKPEEALKNYQDSIAINEKIGQKRAVAAALQEMAQVLASSGKSDAALASYQKGLALLREIGMKKELGDLLINLGVLLDDRGQSDQALQNYQEALQIQRDTGDQNNEALCLSNIASVYVDRGDTGNAFTYYQQALTLREKLGVPGFLAETLSGMGDAYTLSGQYDEAVKTYLRALDLWRQAKDPRGAALVSHQLGMVFKYQGRFGAAINSMQDSIKGLRAIGDRTKDLAEAQNDLADALVKAGRGDEAPAALQGADEIAQELKNDTLMASILNTRGDIDFYRGDARAGGAQYQKALQLAHRGKKLDVVVLSNLNLARVALVQSRPRDAITSLTPAVGARSTFDKNLAIRCSTVLSEAFIQTKAVPRAKQALLSDLAEAEKAGMRLQIARINYLLGDVAKASGNADDAASYYRQTVSQLNSLKNEPGNDKILLRSDLKAMYDQSTQSAGASASK